MSLWEAFRPDGATLLAGPLVWALLERVEGQQHVGVYRVDDTTGATGPLYFRSGPVRSGWSTWIATADDFACAAGPDHASLSG